MMVALLSGSFGLLLGSFLNVCIYRWPLDESVVAPRSHCPSCGNTIAWYDNIPLFSYLLLRGRCRHCHASIPVRYLLVELICGLLAAGMVAVYGLTPLALQQFVFGAISLALVATDWEQRLLPDEFTLGGTVLGLVSAWFVPRELLLAPLLAGWQWSDAALGLLEAALAAALFSGFLWTLGTVYGKLRDKEVLGLGDVKMAAFLGAFLSVPAMLQVLILASVSGLIIGLLYIYLTNKEAGSYYLPFGSFLGGAALLHVVWNGWQHR